MTTMFIAPPGATFQINVRPHYVGFLECPCLSVCVCLCPKSDFSEKLLPQLLWSERTLKMNVWPSRAGHLFFERISKIFVEIFRFQISKISDFRFQNFQISDFKIFRFQISKNFRFQISKFQISDFKIFENFRTNFFLNTNFSNRPKKINDRLAVALRSFRVLSGQSNWGKSFSEISGK